MATVNKVIQKHPLGALQADILAGSGSDGIFICDSSTPFDYSTLTGPNKGKMGYAVKLTSKDGVTSPIVASITVNGVLGNTALLDDATGWMIGEGFVMEIEAMTMTQGVAIILLKKTEEQV